MTARLEDQYEPHADGGDVRVDAGLGHGPDIIAQLKRPVPAPCASAVCQCRAGAVCPSAVPPPAHTSHQLGAARGDYGHIPRLDAATATATAKRQGERTHGGRVNEEDA